MYQQRNMAWASLARAQASPKGRGIRRTEGGMSYPRATTYLVTAYLLPTLLPASMTPIAKTCNVGRRGYRAQGILGINFVDK